ncbi:hypothetical protein B0T13DRAFT_522895 [Neurospora crassa]|nr:hypothetical protein B0T13DRAFT_522895 [Neurospora crassa]
MSEGRGGGGSGGGGWRWIQCQRANVGQGNAATFDEDWGRMRRCELLRIMTRVWLRFEMPERSFDFHVLAPGWACGGVRWHLSSMGSWGTERDVPEVPAPGIKGTAAPAATDLDSSRQGQLNLLKDSPNPFRFGVPGTRGIWIKGQGRAGQGTTEVLPVTSQRG